MLSPVELSPAAASWLLGLGIREAKRAVKNGATPTAEVLAALQALAEVADVELLGFSSDIGTEFDTVGVMSSQSTAWATVAEAAGLVEKSEEYLRRLARDDRVRHRRLSSGWLLDLESLRNVLGRTTA